MAIIYFQVDRDFYIDIDHPFCWVKGNALLLSKDCWPHAWLHTELLCVPFSFSCVGGGTLLSWHSWTITSFPGSFLFQWVSWVTDDVMATRKKEVSERHMRGKRRVGSVYEGEYVLYSTKALVNELFVVNAINLIFFLYRVRYTVSDGGVGVCACWQELLLVLK